MGVEETITFELLFSQIMRFSQLIPFWFITIQSAVQGISWLVDVVLVTVERSCSGDRGGEMCKCSVKISCAKICRPLKIGSLRMMRGNNMIELVFRRRAGRTQN